MRTKNDVQVTLRGSETALEMAAMRLCQHFTLVDAGDTFPGRCQGEYVRLLTVSAGKQGRAARLESVTGHDANDAL